MSDNAIIDAKFTTSTTTGNDNEECVPMNTENRPRTATNTADTQSNDQLISVILNNNTNNNIKSSTTTCICPDIPIIKNTTTVQK